MYAQSIIKNLFSIINIFLITYLLIDRKNNQEYRKKNWYSYVLCIGSIFLVRVMENGVSIHIVYNYITIVIIVMFIGHFLFQRNMKYCILIGSIFLSISLLGQLLSSIFLYPYSGNRVLAELPGIYQVVMMVIAESVIIAGCLTLKKIIERIPPHLSSINVMTIFIPLLLNIIVMAVCTDNLYNDKKVIIGNIWSVITISIVPIVMFLGTVCNIVILENYLNVKKIENEKKLQISEMSLQYDYYMKQSKDMENIRRLSAFEKYVDKNRKSYTIAGNSFGSSVYTTALNTSTGDLMYSAAKHAKGLAADAQKESSYDSAGRQSVQHAIQTVTQYMYKFGKEVGIY